MERIQRALDLARGQPASAPEASIAPILPAPEVRLGVIGLSDRPARADSGPAVLPSTQLRTLSLQSKDLRSRNVVLAHETTPAAHAYRMLRTRVLQKARAEGARVFGIVSGAQGEGKTLTAVNLAISLAAEPNQSVTLVDLDLRRPRVSKVLGIKPSCGLETWLGGNAPAQEVCCHIDTLPRLRVVPTLAPLTGSSETLAGSRPAELFETLQVWDRMGLIIVDLPPALLTDDVLTVAPIIHGFILVVTEGRTLRDDVQRVVELLGRERIVGTVLNGSLSSETRAY
jgi:protein-tyrosine kinase